MEKVVISSVCQAINSIRDYCLELFGDKVLSIILYGSAVSNDFIFDPTWTDIDFMVICNSMSEEQLTEEEKKLDDVSRRIAENFPWLKGSSGYALFGCNVETQESLANARLDFGYKPIWLNGVLDDYRVLYGKDVLKSIELAQIKKLDALYTLMTTRRHQLMWQTVWKRGKDKGIGINEAIPIVKDCIFGAKDYLHYCGIHLYSKPEIVKTFVQYFPQYDRTGLLKRILKAREEHLNPKKDAKFIIDLAYESDQFVSNLVNDLNLPLIATDPRLYVDLDKLLGKASRYLYRAVVEHALLINEGKVKEATQYNPLVD